MKMYKSSTVPGLQIETMVTAPGTARSQFSFEDHETGEERLGCNLEKSGKDFGDVPSECATCDLLCFMFEYWFLWEGRICVLQNLPCSDIQKHVLVLARNGEYLRANMMAGFDSNRGHIISKRLQPDLLSFFLSQTTRCFQWQKTYKVDGFEFLGQLVLNPIHVGITIIRAINHHR